MIAWNAVVEVARASEQGRGPAVVASEARSLAQRSAEAAKQINEAITTSLDRVEAGARLVNEAGETMQQVMGSIHEVSTIVGEISRVSAEQSIGVRQLGEQMNAMGSATRQNAALVDESASATEELRGQPDLLLQAAHHSSCLSHQPLCATQWCAAGHLQAPNTTPHHPKPDSSALDLFDQFHTQHRDD